ncbi:uncharacterized protein LOC127286774 [Leptopilina boulardi]|uniref:uncharacterized protein LOC127286774 n=1 Tax=Leptopilina boulardi TaxID=63433 RepID=UPI0021F55EA4|nr:uncharacterized protein LOC127286774 [Leptopilina boulardi]
MVWKGEGLPEEWRTGLIIPIRKKGEGVKVEEYRGVSLLPVAYKVYAEVVRRRLEEKVEALGCIPHNQTGFRREMGTIDNIYVINYLINRNLRGKNGKLIATFVDFKAAFPSVNRGVLWRVLRERGIEQGLVKRIKEFYEDTRERVRVGSKLGNVFWLARGLRQGCPLSPLLFNLLIADLEERMEKRRKGGVSLGKRRVYILAYADDVALMAENESGMRLLMNEFEGYVREKELCVNVEKTKVLRFRKKRMKDDQVWKLNGKKVEESMNVSRRIERAARMMGQVWGIDERRFKDDWKKRAWLFDALVWSVLSYGVEVWRWREIGKVERMPERFLRWTMGVGWNCPGYMLREELGREKIVLRQRKRAMGLEEKLGQGRGSSLAQECWRLVKNGENKGGGDISKWEKGRKEAISEGLEWVGIGKDLLEGWGRKHKEERWEKIVNSRYNKWYRAVRGEGMPSYLGKMKKYARWNRVCKFRMGEGMRECKYWMGEEEKICRMCGYEREDWEHVLERCVRGMDEEQKGIEEKLETEARQDR